MKAEKIISQTSEWSFESLKEFEWHIGQVATEYGLDTFPNQLEIINSEQMMDAYASVGMPIGYYHWSFGKQFLAIEQNYRRGQMGLAYEMVINSNPCITYLLEENTAVMQAIVIAHACYGHNAFFKNNYLFKTWTHPEAIIDYLLFARHYIIECEEKYGFTQVEDLLDSCHALMNYGVDRYQHPPPLSAAQERQRQREREAYLQTQINILWSTLPQKSSPKLKEQPRFPLEPQENILYFIEKNAPLLEPWQREIVRIIRKLAQYFYPQRQTKVMNEGWATFWHYTLLNTLYERGQLSEAFMLEFLQHHTQVIFQPGFDKPYYNGINPYTLGNNIFTDLRRICETPTPEDKNWFPEIAGNNWLTTLDFAMRNFKDESFIAQYLSPKVIRDMRLFALADDEREPELIVTAIHNEAGYEAIRQILAKQYDLSQIEPNIQVYDAKLKDDRSLTLRYVQHAGKLLAKNTLEVLKHVYRLWGFTVRLETVDKRGKLLKTYQCPE